MKGHCQYCFVKYDECTCCEYCGFIKGTCQCHLEGEWPCTKLHPSDSYRMLHKNPDRCLMLIGAESLTDIDNYIMQIYTKDVWPERLKNT